MRGVFGLEVRQRARRQSWGAVQDFDFSKRRGKQPLRAPQVADYVVERGQVEVPRLEQGCRTGIIKTKSGK